MKFLVSILTVLFTSSVFAQSIVGTVTHIDDGDTLTVLDGDHHQTKIRLAEIDAPEVGHGRNKPGQPFGQNSKQALADMCFQQSAVIEVITSDKYGRTVGRVTCAGKDANLALVNQGMAWAYRQYNRRPEIVKAESEARAARRGLWTDSNPVPPWEYRHGN